MVPGVNVEARKEKKGRITCHYCQWLGVQAYQCSHGEQDAKGGSSEQSSEHWQEQIEYHEMRIEGIDAPLLDSRATLIDGYLKWFVGH